MLILFSVKYCVFKDLRLKKKVLVILRFLGCDEVEFFVGKELVIFSLSHFYIPH